MAELRNKVQNALDETRILVLGSQVLLGMQFRAVFEERFAELARPLQIACVLALLLMVSALALLILPATFHRLVERGEDTQRLHAFIGGAMRPALVPFVLVLGLDVVAAGTTVLGFGASTVVGTALVAAAGGYLVVLEKQGEKRPSLPSEEGPTPLDAKIRHVLTEARVVLPGAQALLGFQFVSMLTKRFSDLPAGVRGVHFASFICVAVATMLLMAPAAYHRIVLHGEETEGFHRYASGMLLGALVWLGFGVCGDVYVVMRLVTAAPRLSVGVGLAMLVGVFGLWFAVPLALRRPRREQPA